MVNTAKRLLAILLMLCIVACCTGCDDAKITALAIKDIPANAISVGATSDELKVEVEYFRTIQTNDVKAVIEDDSIISVEYEAKESLLSGYYVSYTITGLKAGKTSFYFETADETVKSNVVEIEIVPASESGNNTDASNATDSVSNIISIDFNDTSDILLSEYMNDEVRYFKIQSHDDSDNFDEFLEYISEDPNVATVEYKKSYTSNCCIIKRVGVGETYIYVQTKDGAVQSAKIKVISSETPTEDPNATEDNSRIVYVTNYGKKYHYSASGAGSNPIEITEDEAKYSHDPCSKCVG